MNSRANILAAVKASQPDQRPLPEPLQNAIQYADPAETFAAVLAGIGGIVIPVKDHEAILTYVEAHFKGKQRIISVVTELPVGEQNWQQLDPHQFEDVSLAILQAHFGVAENAALWITEDQMQQRAIPFICDQLAVVVHKSSIYSNMQQAYAHIGNAQYGFGAFIAGPSKTADIEQSLVLGAHGPKNMTVFMLG